MTEACHLLTSSPSNLINSSPHHFLLEIPSVSLCFRAIGLLAPQIFIHVPPSGPFYLLFPLPGPSFPSILMAPFFIFKSLLEGYSP